MNKSKNAAKEIFMAKLFVFLSLSCFVLLSQSYAAGDLHYEKGIQFRDSGADFSARLNGLIQSRHQLDFREKLQDANSFSVPRARLKLSGHLYDPRLRFVVQPEFGGSQNTRLLDAIVQWQFEPTTRVQAGQFLVAFTREFMQSGGELHLVERSLVGQAFGLGRDIGLSLNADLARERLHTSLFVINGDGANSTNQNKAMVFGGRAQFDLLDAAGFEAVDFERSLRHRLSLGAGGALDLGNASLGGSKLIRALADLIWRYQGASAALEAHFVRNTKWEENDFGFLAELGYLVYRDMVELVVRHDSIIVGDLSALGLATAVQNGQRVVLGSENQHETSIGVNAYLYRHQAKFQFDISSLLNPNGIKDRQDLRLRSQVQLSF